MMQRSMSQSVCQNLALDSKISFYREKYNQSQTKFKTKYSWVSESLKKSTTNSDRKPIQLKINKRNNSARSKRDSKDEINPKQVQMQTLNPQMPLNIKLNKNESNIVIGIKNQTIQISEYAQKNTQLLSYKANLQEQIRLLKQQIAKENKLNSNANWNCGQLKNKIEKINKRFDDVKEKTTILEQNINKTKQQITVLSRINQQKTKQSKEDQKYIKYLEEQCYNLSQIKIVNLKAGINKQENERVKYKTKLIQELKVMQNSAILFQQNLNQREHLKSNIENYVTENRMQDSLMIKSPKKALKK